SRAQKRGVEHVRAIGRGDDDDAFVAVESVHLHEERIEGLLAFVVSSAETGTTLATDRVDFIDEHDAGRVFAALFEHVPNPARSNTDEHFYEVGTADAEERNIRLAGDGFGQKGFAGARR